jgi:tetratricopeptide (TPR) repeat protein
VATSAEPHEEEPSDRDPTTATEFFKRGIAHNEKHSYDTAVADFREAIRLERGNVTAYLNRGISWSRAGDYARALADFDSTILLDPSNAMALCCSAGLRATCPEAQYRDGERAVTLATRACRLTGYRIAGRRDLLTNRSAGLKIDEAASLSGPD